MNTTWNALFWTGGFRPLADIHSAGHPAADMMFLISLLALSAGQLPPEIGVVVSLQNGRCTYWQSPDAYFEKTSGLRKYLKWTYKQGGRRAVISVRAGTPIKCVGNAKAAAEQGGFPDVIIRASASNDVQP
ncbi:hypothetical protein HMP06_0342 [Sphingomonas sp. HMP6]|nr:hypothetical protein HMP06_0342 [Sphingomonas sp. HMP6]